VEWDIMMTIVAVVLMRDEAEVHMMTVVEADMAEEMGIGGVKALLGETSCISMVIFLGFL
jgi:hypothetical protein